MEVSEPDVQAVVTAARLRCHACHECCLWPPPPLSHSSTGWPGVLINRCLKAAADCCPANSAVVCLAAALAVRMTWNVWPQSRLEAAKCVVPFTTLYSPAKQTSQLQVGSDRGC
jgi:hypothetical protein